MISSKQRFTVLCILDLIINFDITYVESDMMNGIRLKLIRLDSAQSFQSFAKKGEIKRVKQNLLAHLVLLNISMIIENYSESNKNIPFKQAYFFANLIFRHGQLNSRHIS